MGRFTFKNRAQVAAYEIIVSSLARVMPCLQYVQPSRTNNVLLTEGISEAVAVFCFFRNQPTKLSS